MIQADSISYVTTCLLGERGHLIPEKALFEELSNSFAAKLEQAGITEESLQESLPETRLEVARERYPELFSDQPEVG
jgi:hypothetical protein